MVRKLVQLLKEREFNSVYEILEMKKYNYTVENFEKDFKTVNSTDKFCYLVYLLSKDYSIKNTLLLCDFLMYTDTFFYDIHSVIQLFVRRALEMFPTEPSLLDWIISTYENHPDSPFKEEEIIVMKKRREFREKTGDG